MAQHPSALVSWLEVGHRGGGIVYHRHDEKELNWEPGGVGSGQEQGSAGPD